MLFRIFLSPFISAFFAFLKISIFSSQLGGLFIIYRPTLSLFVSLERLTSIQYLASFSILQLRQTPAWAQIGFYIIRILHKQGYKVLQQLGSSATGHFGIVLILRRISLATCNGPINKALPTEAHALCMKFSNKM